MRWLQSNCHYILYNCPVYLAATAVEGGDGCQTKDTGEGSQASTMMALEIDLGSKVRDMAV